MAIWYALPMLLLAASAASDEVEDRQARVVAVLQDFGYALGKIQGETLGVPFFAKLCADIDPDGREVFASRLAAWRERNQKTIDEIQQRFDSMKKLDSKSAKKWDDMLASQGAKVEEQLSQELLSKSALDARLSCRKISEVVTAGDLKLKFAKELAVILAFPGSLEQALK